MVLNTSKHSAQEEEDEPNSDRTVFSVIHAKGHHEIFGKEELKTEAKIYCISWMGQYKIGDFLMIYYYHQLFSHILKIPK